MSRVLLTGGSGFLGSQIVAPLLEAGHEVHVVSRTQPSVSSQRLVWHCVDLTDAAAAEAAVRNVAADLLMHTAWYVEHGLYWQSPENVVWVEATLRLLRAFVAAGGRRAVIAGSCAEYGWSLDEPYQEHTAPLEPATLYGVAKHATHIVAERFAGNVGLELAWGRIFMPYGPGEVGARLVPSVIQALLDGREAPVSDGAQVRDFMYVEDLARGFVAILDSSVQGAINVASGSCCTIHEMVSLVAETVGRPELVRWGALPARPGDPLRLVADVSRLLEEVGFTPAVGLEQGVRRTVAWWRRASS